MKMTTSTRKGGPVCLKLVCYLATALSAAAGQRLVDSPPPPGMRGWNWPSTPPVDCPFQPSDTIRAVQLTGRHAAYTKADTFYPSWGADGRLYSPFTDGSVNEIKSWSGGDKAVVGHAIIEGSDPLALKVVEPDVVPGNPAPYGGRYPCGSLHYNGVWYLGTYALANAPYGLNWPIMGPCAGFHISTDNGRTWAPSPGSCLPGKALFPEPEQLKGPVKFGSPHFVDFGRNMEHSPDGMAYLVGHGSTEPDETERPANLSWITGDQIYLCRVKPTPQTINDAAQYEYFADNNTWSHRLADAKPIAEWNNNMGCVTMTYDAPLKKYLMCVTDGVNTVGKYNTYILESSNITGPWRLATYWKDFGKEAYFVNLPSKFIGADGRTAWLCYSANWGHQNRSEWIDPPGSQYSMCLQEIKLLSAPAPATPDIPAQNPLASADNIAAKALLTPSSVRSGYSVTGAVDGIVLHGYTGDTTREWASDKERETAMLRLTWSEEQTVDRVWLFDRLNDPDQVAGGLLIFSDGSTEPVGALPDDARQGIEIFFPPKRIKWLIFAVTAVKPSSRNIGLSEIAVFRCKP